MLITEPPAEIAPRLWMLGTSLYPLYLYRGADGATIFEGGVVAMGPLVVEQLQELQIRPASVKQVVITHGHPDHVMAVPLFREIFPEVRVLASDTAAKTLSFEKAMVFFSQIDEALTNALATAGVIAAQHRPKPLTEKQIAVDTIIAEGDQIEVDEGVVFDVLQTPGHSDCSLSFFEPKAKTLLISDATGYYMPQHDGWWPNYFSSYADYLASMRRLAGLGAVVLCLSHNAVVQGADVVRDYLDRAIADAEAYHKRIVDAIIAGKPTRQLAEELGAEAHAKTPLLPVDFFQKNCGLMVKLSMKHEGIVAEK